MDNRRPTTTDNAPRNLDRNNNYRNEGGGARSSYRGDRDRPNNYRSNNEGGDRSSNHRSDGDRPNSGGGGGSRRFEPRDNRYPPRGASGGERYQNRDERPPRNSSSSSNNNAGGSRERYQNRDNYQSRDNRPPTRDDRYQGRDNRSQTRDDRYQPRDARGSGSGSSSSGTSNQSRGGERGRFQLRSSGGERDRYAPRDNKFQPRGSSGGGGRFQPRAGGSNKPYKPWEREQQQIRIVSDMQVTDGKHRGKYLQSTASERVRPTARRIREVMFRILYRRIRAGRFLDLCAGAGTVGIEAISRGALIGTFVERSAKMCSFIKKNLAACGIKEGHGEVCEIEAVPFLKRMEKRRRFWDVVYFDPPYDSDYDEVLERLARGAAVKPGGILVVEHHVEMFFPETVGTLERWRVVTQGETSLSFYERK